MMKIEATITKVSLEKNKGVYTLQDLATLTEVKIAEIDADVEIFTDGSISGAQQKKRSGSICTRYERKCANGRPESRRGPLLII